MWLLGGLNNAYGYGQDWSKRVWSSGDGITWSEHIFRNVNGTNAIWEEGTFSSFTVFKNKIWLLGGKILNEENNDVCSFPHTIGE